MHTCNNFDKSNNLSKIQNKDGVTGQGNDRSWAWWKYFGSKHIPGSEIEGEKYIVLFSTLGQEFETWSMVARFPPAEQLCVDFLIQEILS